MRDIGLHLRLQDSLVGLAERAHTLGMPVFQCFFLHQKTGRLIRPSYDEVTAFLRMRDHFKKLFVHSSYWTNLASIGSISLRTLRYEMSLAKRLGFTHIVVHPGSAKGADHIDQGIDALVRRLNRLLKYERDVTIVLENTAHGKLSVGGDLYDFKKILNKCDYPEKLAFCIDTVHAHAYGYRLQTSDEQHVFFDELEKNIGFERIALIHLNNTQAAVGSCIDRHAFLCDGIIRQDALKRFVLNKYIATIPIIMELPHAGPDVEKKHVDLVRCWHR